jgi:hypothetical protein
MSKQPNKLLTQRVRRAAGKVMARNCQLTYPELFMEMGILSPKDYKEWQAGRIPFLEKVIHSNLTKLARVMTAVRRLARDCELLRTVGRRPKQRYSKNFIPCVEEEYRSIYSAGRGRTNRSQAAPSRIASASDPGCQTEMGPIFLDDAIPPG